MEDAIAAPLPRVLLCDDQIVCRCHAKRILKGCNVEVLNPQRPCTWLILFHQVVETQSGEETLAVYDAAEAEGRPFSLIVMVCEMPAGARD